MSRDQPSRRFYTAGTHSYMPGLLALCRSFRALHPADKLVVVKMPRCDLTEHDQALLAGAGAEFQAVPFSPLLSFIDSCLPAHQSKYGLETYAKIALVEISSEPFYWIDSDMIVRSVVDPLRRAAGGGMAVACPISRPRASCFRDPGDPRLHEWILAFSKPDTYLAANPSFNCGLMWLDPVRLRQAGFLGLARAVLTHFGDQLIIADESIFNLLADRVDLRFFPRRSQLYVGLEALPAAALRHAPWVMHFMGVHKPWITGPSHPGWRYYERWLNTDELTIAQVGRT